MRICVMGSALSVHTQRWASAYAARGHEWGKAFLEESIT